MHERFAILPAVDAASGLSAALERQAAALDELAVEVSDIRLELPEAGDSGVWSGLAHNAYVAGVATVVNELATAEATVKRALRHTRRAIATMADHVG